MDRGAWQATAHGVAKSWTRLNNTLIRFLLLIVTFKALSDLVSTTFIHHPLFQYKDSTLHLNLATCCSLNLPSKFLLPTFVSIFPVFCNFFSSNSNHISKSISNITFSIKTLFMPQSNILSSSLTPMQFVLIIDTYLIILICMLISDFYSPPHCHLH